MTTQATSSSLDTLLTDVTNSSKDTIPTAAPSVAETTEDNKIGEVIIKLKRNKLTDPNEYASRLFKLAYCAPTKSGHYSLLGDTTYSTDMIVSGTHKNTKARGEDLANQNVELRITKSNLDLLNNNIEALGLGVTLIEVKVDVRNLTTKQLTYTKGKRKGETVLAMTFIGDITTVSKCEITLKGDDYDSEEQLSEMLRKKREADAAFNKKQMELQGY